MENERNSKKVRNGIIKYYGYVNDYFNKKDESEINEAFWNSLNSFDRPLGVFKVLTYSPFTIMHDLKVGKILTITSKIQMFTDFYRYVKYYDTMSNSDNITEYKDITSYEDIKKLFSNRHMANKMLYFLFSYNEISGFDKVLLNKCLEETDINILKNVNPFFESEYNATNVDVDLDFLKRQIEKWQKSYPDDIEKSYMEASYFLFDLYKINKEECESVIIDLIRQDLGIYSCNEERENTIKIGQAIFDEDKLSMMLKDYYKYETKELIKR